MNNKGSTLEAAHGRWQEILPMFGVPIAALNGKHHPCPSCGGKDRFRFHDRDGDGDYYCSQCGAGKGISLVAKVNDMDYAEAAKMVDKYIDNKPATYRTKPMSETRKVDTRAAALEILKHSKPIEPGDPAWLYLYSRGLKVQSISELKFVPELYCSETESNHPAMVGLVRDVKGVGQTLHRTYLASDGGKANLNQCRKLMPGGFPKGGAIRLMPAAARMGVAEGIETAMSASVIGNMPVWSTVSEALMQAWIPPEEAKEIIIWADNDANYVGQTAAYALAKRLSLECGFDGDSIKVMIPDRAGTDWNDVLLREKVEDERWVEISKRKREAEVEA